MKSLVIGGLASGALSVLLCNSRAGTWASGVVANLLPERMKDTAGYLLGCNLCCSVWLSCAMLDKFSIREWAATVALAQFTVLILHWSLSTEEEEEVDLDTREVVEEAKRGMDELTQEAQEQGFYD